MTESIPEATASTAPPAETPTPAAAAPAQPAAPATQPARRSLEDLLGSLDDDARAAVMGEVSKARNEARNLRERVKEAEPIVSEWQKLQEASKTDVERANDAAAAAQQRVTQLTTRAVQAEVKALAATSFADPSDAAAFVDPAKYVNDAGDIDTEAIKADLADLLTRKPHLGLAPAARVPAPNPAQGSSANGAPAVAQLTEAEVKRMYEDRQYDEIEKARQEGRLATYLGG